MADFIKWIDGRSKLVKILFCLPVIDIIWGVYRLLLAIKDKNWARLVLAIIWIEPIIKFICLFWGKQIKFS